MKKIREFISTIAQDKKDHVFVASMFNWMLFCIYALFGTQWAVTLFLIYCIIVIVWELIDKKLDLGDILASIIPVLPIIVIMLI